MTHIIKLQPGKPATAHPDKQDIFKENNDHVRWEADSNDWTVVFDGESPFERDYFDPSHSESKEIKVAPGDKHYKYTVYLGGEKGDDPIIVVS